MSRPERAGVLRWFRANPLVSSAGAGFLAAVATNVVPGWIGKSTLGALLGSTFFSLFPGICFAFIFAAYLRVCRDIHSITKAIVFAVVSAIAYDVAVLATMFAPAPMGFPAMSATEPSPASWFLVGGFVGGFILLVGAQLLYSRGTGIGKVLIRAIAGAIPAAILGMVGWATGPILKSVLSSRLDPIEVNAREACNYTSLYVVWQTGMAMVLSKLCSAPSQPALTKPISPRPSLGFRAVRATLLLLSFASGSVLAIKGDRSFLESPEKPKIENPMSRPRLENLPLLQPVPPQEVLLLESIGSLVPGAPEIKEYAYLPDYMQEKRRRPPAVGYFLGYDISHRSAVQLGAPMVRVEVREYPNKEWARFSLGEVFLSGDAPTKQQRAGHTILFSSRGYPDNGDFYYWSSGNRVIIVRDSSGQASELLRHYLEKYPETL